MFSVGRSPDPANPELGIIAAVRHVFPQPFIKPMCFHSCSLVCREHHSLTVVAPNGAARVSESLCRFGIMQSNDARGPAQERSSFY